MNIQNDIVTFDSKDISQFSDAVQAALCATAGEGRTPEEVLSCAVNKAIANSQGSRVNGLLESMRPAAEKLAGMSSQDATLAKAAIADAAGISEDNHL